MIDKVQRLEKITEIAKARTAKLIDAANPKSNYEQISRKLNRDFKTIQWYAIQRNSLGYNQAYQNYSMEIMNAMDVLYDKIKGAQR